MVITYGIDEAGRGPVLGPMVLAVVGLSPSGTRRLHRAGVGDSKQFGSGPRAKQRRAELAMLIREHASAWEIETVPVDVIDAFTFRGQLNELERQTAVRLLKAVKASQTARIICDGARMFAPLSETWPRLAAVDRGESVHASVAAASILAKDTRDRAMDAIAERYRAEFGTVTGGGYLNAGTRRFLTAYREKHGALPPEARQSWGAKRSKSS